MKLINQKIISLGTVASIFPIGLTVACGQQIEKKNDTVLENNIGWGQLENRVNNKLYRLTPKNVMMINYVKSLLENLEILDQNNLIIFNAINHLLETIKTNDAASILHEVNLFNEHQYFLSTKNSIYGTMGALGDRLIPLRIDIFFINNFVSNHAVYVDNLETINTLKNASSIFRSDSGGRNGDFMVVFGKPQLNRLAQMISDLNYTRFNALHVNNDLPSQVTRDEILKILKDIMRELMISRGYESLTWSDEQYLDSVLKSVVADDENNSLAITFNFDGPEKYIIIPNFNSGEVAQISEDIFGAFDFENDQQDQYGLIPVPQPGLAYKLDQIKNYNRWNNFFEMVMHLKVGRQNDLKELVFDIDQAITNHDFTNAINHINQLNQNHMSLWTGDVNRVLEWFGTHEIPVRVDGVMVVDPINQIVETVNLADVNALSARAQELGVTSLRFYDDVSAIKKGDIIPLLALPPEDNLGLYIGHLTSDSLSQVTGSRRNPSEISPLRVLVIIKNVIRTMAAGISAMEDSSTRNIPQINNDDIEKLLVTDIELIPDDQADTLTIKIKNHSALKVLTITGVTTN